jgi:hypothetical protein
MEDSERARLIREGLARYSRLVRELAVAGAQTVGPTATASTLAFAARAVEAKARREGAWSEPQAAIHAEAHEKALVELERRAAARAAGIKL